MKKKQLFLIILSIIYIIYIVFLLFAPSQYISVYQEMKLTQNIGSFLNHIPYLKFITLKLTNIYVLIAVFFFISGYLYKKREPSFFIIFIIISVLLYLFILKINYIFALSYRAKELFSIYLTIFSFIIFSQEKNENIKIIPRFFLFISFFSCFFTKNITISGILLSFIIGFIIGKSVLKIGKIFF
jgi:hypothetical protein